jgi:nucleoside-diphosphate-sugar epimerase
MNNMRHDKARPAVVITGVAGNLGLRLLPQLHDFSVIGIDVNPPKTDQPLRFLRADLGQESFRQQLIDLFRETRPVGVVHLAFVLDQVRMGVFNLEHMWHINVAGTTRVMEAISEVNHNEGGIEKFIFPSSVSAYGPSPQPLSEDSPLQAHTYPYGESFAARPTERAAWQPGYVLGAYAYPVCCPSASSTCKTVCSMSTSMMWLA